MSLFDDSATCLQCRPGSPCLLHKFISQPRTSFRATPRFDAHMKDCVQCTGGPYDLCVAGGDLLVAEVAEWPSRDPFMPWSVKEIAAYVVRLLRETCGYCGRKLIRQPPPSWGLNVVCPSRLLNDAEATRHAYFPIDTGPFSLGRRVD